ncbi:alpha-tocopherol transfer protein-like [Belonocnema kinseyi]|uniref:alpha-tocopherol transfer protein-like n=1 Tax=Belonocnema kinseyi TaxID=2817044 RepID=UPI00143D6E8F|nr:alpha-tocopherol transfer protein-like [Belonocnema kinseyi]XP_033212544.1 alpha-tocopherol transfer protein-like [Belonocnema kinseyi]
MKLGFTIEECRIKHPELTNDLLDELRVWGEQRGLPNIPDEQLALFAHSCYFNKNASMQCMEVYYKLKATTPEFFNNRDLRAEYLQNSMKALHLTAFPVPDREGRTIIFGRLADTRPGEFMLNNGIKLLIMILDASLYTAGCTPGYVFLFDMSGVKLGHLTRLSISSLRKFFQFVQEGMPIRLQGIHVLNTVWFMNRVVSIIRPLMKKEIFEMLRLYSGEVSEIYEYIPPECLPKDFGGALDSIETLHDAQYTKLHQLLNYFLEEEKLYNGWHSVPKKLSSASSNYKELQEDTTIEKIPSGRVH